MAFALILIGAFCVGGALVPFAILRPVARELGSKPIAVLPRIYLIDLFALLVLVQVVFAFVALQLYVVAIPLAVGLLYAWWRGTEALSRLGVRNSLRRAVFLVFLMPTAIFLPFAALGAVLYIMQIGFALSPGEFKFWSTLGMLVAVAMMFACRWLARWVLAGAEMQPQPSIAAKSDGQ